jgi:type IV fimbrial biogenesis protein FimT
MEKYRFRHRLPQPLPRGFTLIEMMVTVALLIILGAMAAPALQSYVTRSGMQTLQNDFTHSLTRTRSEALARNTCVSMCQLKSGETDTCETTAAKAGQWHKGWMIFEWPQCAPPDVTKAMPPVTVIQVRQAGNSRFSLTESTPSIVITYDARGALQGGVGSATTINLADSQDPNLSPYARKLTISAQGRLMAQSADPTTTSTTAGVTQQ